MEKLSQSRQWARATLDEIHAMLKHRDYSSTSDEATQERNLQHLYNASNPSTTPVEARIILENLERLSERLVKTESAERSAVLLPTRRLYSDCRLFHSLLDLWDSDAINDTIQWERAVTRLDMAIIVAGAPGENRLDLILDTIKVIQDNHLPLSDLHFDRSFEKSTSYIHSPSALPVNTIPCLIPPSLSKFTELITQPFILKGFLRDWPALQEHPWKSPSYLLHVSGRGRKVPVEVGSDYRAEGWSQKIMSWESFLTSIEMISPLELENTGFKLSEEHESNPPVVYYLAQHTLLTQFPELRSDIIIPDYVYAAPDAPKDFPNYRPPTNEEHLIINAWLGPKGTLSPAHTDPYFNCYAQVVGRKSIWLASPKFQQEMYPFADPNAPHTTKTGQNTGDGSTNEGRIKSEPSMTNTSMVDVFSSENAAYTLFDSVVRPHALSAVLEPGDMLFIPPGWWHAMRSEDISFSVSMWF